MQRLARALLQKSKSTLKTSLQFKNVKAQSTGVKNNVYAEQMYEAWSQDPNSVHSSWNQYFSSHASDPKAKIKDASAFERVKEQTDLFMKGYVILQRFKSRGHELADLDPLNLIKKYGHWSQFGVRKQKDILEGIVLDDMELDTPFMIEQGDYLKEIAFFLQKKEIWTLREIIEYSQKIYTGKFGAEFFHIESQEQRHWIQERSESLALNKIPNEIRLKTLEKLTKNDVFNTYLKEKFLTKRFGVEGCDSFVSGLDNLTYKAVQSGVDNIVIGMAHRGRLNTLAYVLNKPLEEIMAEFQDMKGKAQNEGQWGGAGDVKYHLGVSVDRKYGDKKLNMRILANPSHLEAVNPCVMGTTRAIQDFKQDHDGSKTVGILVHGDSAFSGQGVVYESLQMSSLNGFTSHGVIHVIINNQIGFTTLPSEYRSGHHCTEVAKTVESPIFHVNADEPDLVDEVMAMAFEFRQKFKKDVVVDIIGYRKYGHNELDQPKFTQPIMYEVIDKMSPVVELYKQRLIAEGLITEEEHKKQVDEHNNRLAEAHRISRDEKFNIKEWQSTAWEQVRETTKFGAVKNTCVPVKKLQDIGLKLTTIPESFNLHPLIKKIFELRQQSITQGKRIDMATAESLAWGTLLYEGFGVRLSGQDVERGTFSHRHSVLIDQKSDNQYIPFHALLTPEQIQKQLFNVRNSHLSEYGVLGFEYGYSIANPNVLVMWEAQFGDFANGAQIMIDNFIATGETKWGVPNGLVLLLPHGYDGQGAEHSSARLERFLQLTDDDYTKLNPNRTERIKKQVRNTNWQVVNCSTSVNYFHALRRQIRRDFRKPLICMTSKRLLRLKEASSDLAEFEKQERFNPCYPDQDPKVTPDKIKRVVLCSGQVYYDITEKQREQNKEDLAVIRIEQLAPFPYDFIKDLISQYPNADFVWCQEEHKNQGAWVYVQPRINTLLNELKLNGKFATEKEVKYIGRKASASTAAGGSKIHQGELKIFIKNLLEY